MKFLKSNIIQIVNPVINKKYNNNMIIIANDI